MKDSIAPLKVGIVVILAALALVYMLSQVQESVGGDAKGYRVFAIFDDVGGLAEKSGVSIAGINVGRIETIELAGDKARVWIRLQTPLKSDARIAKRQASLLGEYYLKLTPGYTGTPLNDGDEIKFIDYDTPPAALMNDLSGIARNVVDITESLKRALGGQEGEQRLISIIKNFEGVAQDIRDAVSGNNEKFDAVVDNVVAVTGEARQFTAEFRQNARQILGDAKYVVRSVRAIVGENTANVQEGFEGLKGAVTRIQGALDKLESTLSATDAIANRINRGEGTIGQLINDDRLANNVNDIVEESGQFIKKITRLQTIVGMRSDYYADRGTVRNALELRLQPKPDKYYSLQLVDDPRGATRFRETVTNTSASSEDPVTREQQTVTEDRFRLSLQFAKRFWFTTGRIGIIENSGGLGIDMHLLGDDLEISTDLFSFADNLNPRQRAWGTYNFFNHLYVSGGVDEIWNRESRDVFLGFGLRFNDDDLKTILSTAPSPSF